MKVAVTTLAFCVAALLALGLVMLYSSTACQRHAHEVGAQTADDATCLVRARLRLVRDGDRSRLSTAEKTRVADFYSCAVFARAGFRAACRPCESTARTDGSVCPALTFQPSEFAKIALIIMLAWYGDRYQRQMQTFKRGIFFPAAIIVASVSV